MLHLGHYLYTGNLIKLDGCQPKAGKLSAEEQLSGVFTPLNLPQRESMLEHHPDKDYVEFSLNSIKDGFRVSDNRSSESEVALFRRGKV